MILVLWERTASPRLKALNSFLLQLPRSQSGDFAELATRCDWEKLRIKAIVLRSVKTRIKRRLFSQILSFCSQLELLFIVAEPAITLKCSISPGIYFDMDKGLVLAAMTAVMLLTICHKVLQSVFRSGRKFTALVGIHSPL